MRGKPDDATRSVVPGRSGRVPGAPLHGASTVVRVATPDDVDILVQWHADPDIAKYWDGETFTREEMLLRLTRSDVDAYVVEADGAPIGYLQAWFEEDRPTVGGLDMFLTPTARDRGLGPDASGALARWLVSVGGVSRLTVDPYLSNERAIRAWTKAGFERVEEREADDEHTQAWLLMLFAPSD